ncbi:MAG: hypothetical protein J6T01_02225 [Kiritimatiellae bacterium]|nr:hypothetical protein [Kiritimatiellia bacterium]
MKNLLVTALAAAALTAAGVNVSVDLADVRAEVPRSLYGTGMEDVNHEIYGGLDAQRLWDESFEESLPPQVHPYAPTGSGGKQCGRQWEGFATADGVFVRDTAVARLGAASQLLMPANGSAGVANRGLNGWGVPCREGVKMNGRFFARGVVGAIEVMLQRQDGRVTYAKTRTALPAGDAWTEIKFTLTPEVTDPAARFAIVASGGGRVWLDDVYLADAPSGEFGRIGCREDIVAAFRKEGLTFLRWGGSMVNSPDYLLANMRGDRRPYRGFWFDNSSTGFMIREFVEMSALLNLPCAFSIHAYDKTGDAVALAEWLKRFKIDIYVEIGNEECAGYTPAGGRPTVPDVRRYCENLRRLVPAMRRANPGLKFVNAVMWQPGRMELMEEAFRLTDGFVEFWDLHVWAGAVDADVNTREAIRKFKEMSRRLNPKTAMKAAIFEENAYIHDMRRAIAHARVLEAVREAGDFVLTSCPANALQPYRQNDNGWDQGQIFFTPDKVWLQPCGWAQKMASDNHRELLVASSSSDKDVSLSATRDRDGRSVILHLVNSAAGQKPLDLAFKGAPSLSLAKATVLSAPRLEDRNPPHDPERISPRDETAAFRRAPALAPFSYTVLEFRRN